MHCTVNVGVYTDTKILRPRDLLRTQSPQKPYRTSLRIFRYFCAAVLVDPFLVLNFRSSGMRAGNWIGQCSPANFDWLSYKIVIVNRIQNTDFAYSVRPIHYYLSLCSFERPFFESRLHILQVVKCYRFLYTTYYKCFCAWFCELELGTSYDVDTAWDGVNIDTPDLIWTIFAAQKF